MVGTSDLETSKAEALRFKLDAVKDVLRLTSPEFCSRWVSDAYGRVAKSFGVDESMLQKWVYDRELYDEAVEELRKERSDAGDVDRTFVIYPDESGSGQDADAAGDVVGDRNMQENGTFVKDPDDSDFDPVVDGHGVQLEDDVGPSVFPDASGVWEAAEPPALDSLGPEESCASEVDGQDCSFPAAGPAECCPESLVPSSCPGFGGPVVEEDSGVEQGYSGVEQGYSGVEQGSLFGDEGFLPCTKEEADAVGGDVDGGDGVQPEESCVEHPVDVSPVLQRASEVLDLLGHRLSELVRDGDAHAFADALGFADVVFFDRWTHNDLSFIDGFSRILVSAMVLHARFEGDGDISLEVFLRSAVSDLDAALHIGAWSAASLLFGDGGSYSYRITQEMYAAAPGFYEGMVLDSGRRGSTLVEKDSDGKVVSNGLIGMPVRADGVGSYIRMVRNLCQDYSDDGFHYVVRELRERIVELLDRYDSEQDALHVLRSLGDRDRAIICKWAGTSRADGVFLEDLVSPRANTADSLLEL